MTHEEHDMHHIDIGRQRGTGHGQTLLTKLHQADLRKRQDAETLRKNEPASTPATTTTAAKAAKP